MENLLNKIEPLGAQVLLEPVVEQGNKFSIPDGMREQPKRGRVLSTGRLVEYVKEDDIVLYRPYAGDRVSEEPELYLVAEDDIIGRVKAAPLRA